MRRVPVKLVVMEVIMFLGAEEGIDRVLAPVVVLLGLGFGHEIDDFLVRVEPLRGDALDLAAKPARVERLAVDALVHALAAAFRFRAHSALPCR